MISKWFRRSTLSSVRTKIVLLMVCYGFTEIRAAEFSDLEVAILCLCSVPTFPTTLPPSVEDLSFSKVRPPRWKFHSSQFMSWNMPSVIFIENHLFVLEINPIFDSPYYLMFELWWWWCIDDFEMIQKIRFVLGANTNCVGNGLLWF